MKKVVIFNKPIWLVYETPDDNPGIRKILELYGFFVQDFSYLAHKDINYYIDYLCGQSKWAADGNTTDGNNWVKSDGCSYRWESKYIQKYMKAARKQMGITYKVYEIGSPLDDTEGVVDGTYIIDGNIHRNIKKYGIPCGCPKR